MTVAEARRSTKQIICVQVEVSRFGPIASLTFNVILARTGARLTVATRLTAQTSGNVATTRPTSLRSKVVEIGFTSVAFVTGHTGLTLALSITIALQTARSCKSNIYKLNRGLNFTSSELSTCFVTIARDTITVLTLVKVFTASLAVGSVTIGRTVEAVTTVSGRVVKRLVKVAPTRESVAVASCR